MRLAGKRHVCPRGGARLGERGCGADALVHAAEVALSVWCAYGARRRSASASRS
jgi:hypothetical protein